MRRGSVELISGAPEGEFGFKFDRSGYRVPAIIASPWVESGSVYNEEYLHTSLIATLRKTWDLGEAFTRRDASARTFDGVLRVLVKIRRFARLSG
jgi:phospholipase C